MIETARLKRHVAPEPEWLVILTVAALLALGSLLMAAVTGRSSTAVAGDVSITYPEGWAQISEEGASLAVTDLRGGVFGARVSAWEAPKSQFVVGGTALGTASLTDLATMWSLQRGALLTGYRVFRMERTQVRGRDAVDVTYAFLAEARQGAASRIVPRVMQGADTIFEGADRIYVLTFTIDSADFAQSKGLRQRLLDGWRVP